MNQPSLRLRNVDGIRGLSLLGILLANMLCFQYGMWGMQDLSFFNLSAADSIALTALKIVVETSFMPIFAFLFGFGIIKMKENIELSGRPGHPAAHLARRFVFLVVLGLAHYIFLWEGDVLVTYGLAGFGMLLFINAKPRTLFIWGIAFMIIASLISYGALNETIASNAVMDKFNTQTVDVYGSGNFTEIIAHRTTEDPLDLHGFYYIVMLLIGPLLVVPMFLFGMAAAKYRLLHQPENEKALYMKIAAILIPLGLLLKSVKHIFPDFGFGGSINSLGGTILALGYLSAFALLFADRPRWLSGWLNRFESVGKLSLSNYLLQTIASVLVFYGYGLGLFGKAGIIGGIAIGIAIYIAQSFASQLYLRKFRIGPVERILRAWTALQWKPRGTKSGGVNM
ncbi:DUF418 domain-containing protein [Paenibacillus sp. NEAU-GSW1]|uniref:DUF418 domain-containing protein n=1 Tax=Paenibacillus sp. NEAU-GSW1 TaxID=2682486 RepID=UPI0012E16277|nr:DUF418 domain-containing protein [Paenibacillus sp. NEAU-GSW1]MUT65600.1 DUF418 domain-containing protein [Paenibacillus sp. NEAU-GSW1]